MRRSKYPESNRRLEAARCASNDASSTTTSTRLADVLLLLVSTESCTALDVCRLCAVCSELHLASRAEDIWQQLLFSAFPNCAALPRSVLEVRGHQWMYMQRMCSMPPQPDELPPPKPPTISPADLQLLVDVYASDKHISSLTVQGDEFTELLQDSSVTIGLPVMRPVCEFRPVPNFDDEAGEDSDLSNGSGLINDAWMDDEDSAFDNIKWRIVAHLIFVGEGARHGKVVCVHDIRDGRLDNPIDRLGRDWFVRQAPEAIDKGSLDLLQGHAWTVSEYVGDAAIRIDDHELLRRVPYLESLSLLVEINLVLPRAPRWYAYEAINQMIPTLEEANAGFIFSTTRQDRLRHACIPLWQRLSEEERTKACMSAQKAAREDGQNQLMLHSVGVTFFFNARSGNGSTYNKDLTNGVTLLHLLDACHWD